MLLHLTRKSRKVADLGISRIGRGIRLVTTKSPDLPKCPYLLLPMDVVGDSPAGGGEKVVNLNFYDLGKKRRVTMEEQRIPESIHLSRSIGSSRGWMIRMNNEDLTVHVTNMLNPSAPKSSHKVISLPPILPLPHSLDPSESTPLTELVRNASLSSFPDQEDCIVAIKFWGSCISFCRRLSTSDSSSWSWSWTHINYVPSDCKDSPVIYSNAASVFCLNPSSDTVGDPQQFYEHGFAGLKDKHGFPLVAYILQLRPFEPPVTLPDGKRFLVETPSGDLLTIMWYKETVKQLMCYCNKETDVYVVQTKRFELYKRNRRGAESYVGDIGDVCIFFGKNEPFCAHATMYPGLKPNSIYFTEMDQICVYDLATHTIHQLPHQEHLLTPFWLPPILHK